MTRDFGFSANPLGAAGMSLWFVKKLTRNTIAGFTFFLPECHFGFAQNT